MKKCVPLHPQFRKMVAIDKFGAVVQLVRIPACHAGGRGFESLPHRQKSFNEISLKLFCVRPARTCRTQNSQLTRKRKLRRMGLSFMDVRAMMTGVPSGREAGTDMFMKLLSGARSGMLYEYWATPTDTPAEIRLCSLPTPILSPAVRLPKKPS